MPEFRCEVIDYKGSPTFTIFRGETRVFGFGLRKAKAILSLFQEIKDFVEKYDKKEEE